MLMIYTFVFGVVFKSRWGNGGESKFQFALILFSGLMVFNLFSECVAKSPRLIVDNANFVKKVIFPLEVLSVVSLLSACFHFMISFLIWLLAYLIMFGMPSSTFLLAPMVIAPLLFITLGTSWVLSSLGVYFRDLQQVIGPAIAALMFLSPIFYSTASIPKGYQVLMILNPLSEVIEGFRGVIYFGKIPNLSYMLLYYSMSVLVAFLGFWFFQRTRKGFADVL